MQELAKALAVIEATVGLHAVDLGAVSVTALRGNRWEVSTAGTSRVCATLDDVAAIVARYADSDSEGGES